MGTYRRNPGCSNCRLTYEQLQEKVNDHLEESHLTHDHAAHPGGTPREEGMECGDRTVRGVVGIVELELRSKEHIITHFEVRPPVPSA